MYNTNDRINIIWLYYELQLMKEYFLSQRRGVRQKNLNLAMIKDSRFQLLTEISRMNLSDSSIKSTNQNLKVNIFVDKHYVAGTNIAIMK